MEVWGWTRSTDGDSVAGVGVGFPCRDFDSASGFRIRLVGMRTRGRHDSEQSEGILFSGGSNGLEVGWCRKRVWYCIFMLQEPGEELALRHARRWRALLPFRQGTVNIFLKLSGGKPGSLGRQGRLHLPCSQFRPCWLPVSTLFLSAAASQKDWMPAKLVCFPRVVRLCDRLWQPWPSDGPGLWSWPIRAVCPHLWNWRTVTVLVTAVAGASWCSRYGKGSILESTSNNFNLAIDTRLEQHYLH